LLGFFVVHRFLLIYIEDKNRKAFSKKNLAVDYTYSKPLTVRPTVWIELVYYCTATTATARRR
jgi:hypothetical protein